MIDFQSVWLLVLKELRDATRSRWFLLFTIAFAVLALALSWLGLAGVGAYGLAGFSRTGASLINLVLLMVPLMGLILGALSMSSEYERGLLHYLLSQPVTKLELLLGKFIGLGLTQFATLVLGFGLSGLFIALMGGAAEINSYLVIILFAYLLSLVSLALGLGISVVLRRSSAAVGLAIFTWLGLVFFGDLGLMGTAVVLQLNPQTLLLSALINPLQVFKIAAIMNLRGSLEVLGPAGLFAIRTYENNLIFLLLAIMLIWIAVPFISTQWMFKRSGGN